MWIRSWAWLLMTGALGACGGGAEGGAGSGHSPPNLVTSQNQLVGVANLPYASGHYTHGNTDGEGLFELEQDNAGSCAVGSSCSPSIDFPVTFTLCGQALSTIPAKIEDGFITQYTVMNLVYSQLADRTLVANNLQRLIMTAGRSPDASELGITIADSVRLGTCPAFDLHTTDLASETQVFQSLAPRALVSALQAQAVLDEQFNCRNAGIFIGTHSNAPTTAFPDTVSGAFGLFIDIHGQASGALGFSPPSVAPYTGTVLFSGDVGTAHFGFDRFTVTEAGPLQGMAVDFTIFDGNHVGGGWFSPDRQVSGSTSNGSFISSVTRVGGVKTAVAAYRFVDKNLIALSRAGVASPWALDIDIYTGGPVSGTLHQFPQGTEQAIFTGSLTNGLIKASYTSPAASVSQLTLTLDETGPTLTGPLYDPQGNLITTYTVSAPLIGCRLGRVTQ